jgi:hypothetical protein
VKVINFDESGDLGFNFENERTSKYFIVTFLMTDEQKQLSSAVKKVFRLLHKADIKKSGGTLHSHFEKKSTRIRLLKTLAKKDISIAVMKLDKRKVFMVEEPHILYSSMVTSLLNRLYIDGVLDTDEDIRFIASQMDTNLTRKKRFASVVRKGAASPNFFLEITKPSDERGLQAVDFVSWALWRKYELGESEYADLIQDKIIGEYEYY